MAGDDDLASAVQQVWRIPPPGPQNLLADPRFLALSDQLRMRSGNGEVAFALSNALRNLGLPCAAPPGVSPVNSHPMSAPLSL
jgi:hypothetical protein